MGERRKSKVVVGDVVDAFIGVGRRRRRWTALATGLVLVPYDGLPVEHPKAVDEVYQPRQDGEDAHGACARRVAAAHQDVVGAGVVPREAGHACSCIVSFEGDGGWETLRGHARKGTLGTASPCLTRTDLPPRATRAKAAVMLNRTSREVRWIRSVPSTAYARRI